MISSIGCIYKQNLGDCHVANYTSEMLQECLNAIIKGKFSHCKPVDHFNIHHQNNFQKLKKKHTNTSGMQQYFEEQIFTSYAETLSDCNLPLTAYNLHIFIKSCLHQSGHEVKCFQNIFLSKMGQVFLKEPTLTELKICNQYQMKHSRHL
jgi:hypothetical protein